jgi:hypothetical protein
MGNTQNQPIEQNKSIQNNISLIPSNSFKNKVKSALLLEKKFKERNLEIQEKLLLKYSQDKKKKIDEINNRENELLQKLELETKNKIEKLTIELEKKISIINKKKKKYILSIQDANKFIKLSSDNRDSLKKLVDSDIVISKVDAKYKIYELDLEIERLKNEYYEEKKNLECRKSLEKQRKNIYEDKKLEINILKDKLINLGKKYYDKQLEFNNFLRYIQSYLYPKEENRNINENDAKLAIAQQIITAKIFNLKNDLKKNNIKISTEKNIEKIIDKNNNIEITTDNNTNIVTFNDYTTNIEIKYDLQYGIETIIDPMNNQIIKFDYVNKIETITNIETGVKNETKKIDFKIYPQEAEIIIPKKPKINEPFALKLNSETNTDILNTNTVLKRIKELDQESNSIEENDIELIDSIINDFNNLKESIKNDIESESLLELLNKRINDSIENIEYKKNEIIKSTSVLEYIKIFILYLIKLMTDTFIYSIPVLLIGIILFYLFNSNTEYAVAFRNLFFNKE